ncbi:MAG TPA: hypothetical protein VKB75_03030 [Jatrophihabitans sp.]|nr:hypothetical protein [Jatrophihabitans sp.]
MKIALHEVAHSRAGDKGQLITLSLIPYDPAWYPVLCELAQPARIGAHLRDRVVGDVVRYEMPKLPALTFVCSRAGSDSVTTSLHVDGHGKTMSSALLELEIDVPDEQVRALGLPQRWDG